MKKIMKSFLCTLLGVILLTNIFSSNVYATEGNILTYVWASFEATVPEGFDNEVVIWLDNGLTKSEAILTAEEEYIGSARVISGYSYKITMEVVHGLEEYTSTLPEEVFVEDSEWIEFEITKKTFGEVKDVEEGTENSDNMENEDGQLASPQTIYDAYLNTVKDMENNADYETLFALQNIAGNYLLEEDKITAEQWTTMSGYDKYNYAMLVVYPRSNLENNIYKSEDDFISETFEVRERILSGYNVEEKNIKALENVWRWHYNFYKTNGYFCNFYHLDEAGEQGVEQFDEPNISTKSEDEVVFSQDGDIVTKEEYDELEELREAMIQENEIVMEEEEESSMDRLVNAVKEIWVTLLILAVVGIAFAVVAIKNRRKNIKDN